MKHVMVIFIPTFSSGHIKLHALPTSLPKVHSHLLPPKSKAGHICTLHFNSLESWVWLVSTCKIKIFNWMVEWSLNWNPIQIFQTVNPVLCIVLSIQGETWSIQTLKVAICSNEHWICEFNRKHIKIALPFSTIRCVQLWAMFTKVSESNLVTNNILLSSAYLMLVIVTVLFSLLQPKLPSSSPVHSTLSVLVILEVVAQLMMHFCPVSANYLAKVVFNLSEMLTEFESSQLMIAFDIFSVSLRLHPALGPSELLHFALSIGSGWPKPSYKEHLKRDHSF